MTPVLVHRQKTLERAFERLYKRHVHDVYRYTLAVLRHEADAEDVTQATFVSAYRAFCRGERPVKPHNWLIKIAHNECRQRFRASARRPQEVALQEFDGQQRVDSSDDLPTASDIRQALAHLSFNQRAALVMRELEGRSYNEIATVLETSVSAVETLLFRARRALREQLEGSLTCGQAELALSRRIEGNLPQSERGQLRAHLRECKECASLERRQRAHRSALKSTLGAAPLPVSLQSFIGGGTATVGGTAAVAGTGLFGKVAAVVAAGAVAVGATHEAIKADSATPDTGPTVRTQQRATKAALPTAPGARSVASAGRARSRAARRLATQTFEPAGKNAAHRRTLRPSEVADEPADAPTHATGKEPHASSSSSPPVAPAVPVTLPASPEPPALTFPSVPTLPPPPPIELPALPPPLPPLPPLLPLPPLPQLPPPPLPPPPALPVPQGP
jgi:RNA polymerase sigma-70 factor (ECF subfamily)